MPPRKNTELETRLTVRLPEALYIAVRASAEADKRSLNKQIETLLAEALAKRKAKP